MGEKKLDRIIGRYQEKYGLKMDELTATILQEVEDSAVEIVTKKDRDIDRLLLAYAPFMSNDSRASLAYGIGKTLWLLVLSIAVMLAIILYHVRVSNMEEYVRTQAILARYPNVVQLEPLLKYAEIVEDKEGVYIKATPVRKGKMTIGNSYLINNADEIRIPIQFK